MSCRINSRKNLSVILIVIDCLRADHLSCYGYKEKTTPSIDKLAEQGVKFNNAYSNSPWTKPSVASLWTSLHPNSHNAIDVPDILPDEALTIAEIMKENEYFTLYINGGNPSISEDFNFTQGFDKYIETHNDAAALTRKFLAALPKLQEKNFFAYLHYMDAHLPYNNNEFIDSISNKNREFIPGDKGNLGSKRIRKLSKENKLSKSDKDFLIALYDQQIKYVDSNIKKIIQSLQDNKRLDDTVIIITADHGEEFWEHESYEHGHTLYNELLRVPLILVGEGFEPVEIATPVRLIDILPTILSLMNAKTDKFYPQGKNLMKTIKRGRSKEELPVFATGLLYGDEKFCLIKNGKKIIVNTRNEKEKTNIIFYKKRSKLEIYDMEKDPAEQVNMSEGKRRENISWLTKDLSVFMYPEYVLESRKRDLNDRVKEKLRSLGYIE